MVENNSSKKFIEGVLSKCNENTIIGEFSGRDSVAAIIKEMKNDTAIDILPIASFATTEYGDPSSLVENYNKLIEMMGNKKIHNLIYYSNPEIWRILNGRYISLLVEKYGFYNPCIGCHMYFHLLKIPYGIKFGKKVISGERELHETKVKVNQLGICLDAYIDVMKEFGIDLIMPIRYAEKSKEIESLIEWEWKEGKNHPECSLSGNYRDLKGKAMYDEKKLEKYIEEFLKPVSILIGRYLVGDINFNDLNRKVEDIL